MEQLLSQSYAHLECSDTTQLSNLIHVSMQQCDCFDGSSVCQFITPRSTFSKPISVYFRFPFSRKPKKQSRFPTVFGAQTGAERLFSGVPEDRQLETG